MNYQKIYDSLIIKAQLRDWTRKNTDTYLERHHIIPRSLGGDDDKDNLVFLTAREHFLAHWLLFKIKIGHEKSKMANAWFRMCQQNNFQIRYSKHYEKARIAFSNHNPFKEKEIIDIVKDRMTKNNPMKNSEISSKVSKKLKGLMVGEKNGFYGKKHKDETLKKISGENHYTKKEGYIPLTISEEHKEAISKANKGRKRKDLSQRNKQNSSDWIVSTPEGNTFKIKNLNQWAKENQINPFWLYRNLCGYKVIKI